MTEQRLQTVPGPLAGHEEPGELGRPGNYGAGAIDVPDASMHVRDARGTV